MRVGLKLTFIYIQSRLSPFANTKARKERKDGGGLPELKASSKTNANKPRKYKRWFSLIDAATSSQKRALLPVKKLRNSLVLNSKLHSTLHGFIVFEAAWNDVRGINYLNDHQAFFSCHSLFFRCLQFVSVFNAFISLAD